VEKGVYDPGADTSRVIAHQRSLPVVERVVSGVKVRLGFVTNSSSVSYIITMCKPVVEMDELFGGSLATAQLRRFLREQLENRGTRTVVDGTELYVLQVWFLRAGRVSPLAQVVGARGSLHDVELSTLSDEEKWALVHGLIVDNMTAPLRGFGFTVATVE